MAIQEEEDVSTAQYVDHDKVAESYIKEDVSKADESQVDQVKVDESKVAVSEQKTPDTTDKPMSDEEWQDASVEQMAQHISIDGPKTEYAKQTNPFRKNDDRL